MTQKTMYRSHASLTDSHRKLFFIGSCAIATFLVLTSFLHAVVPHHHPGEGHEEHHDVGTITFTLTHAHEEKKFFDLFIPFMFFAFFIFVVLVSEDISRRSLVTRQRTPSHIPVYLSLLFSEGILHPKIP